VAGFSREFVESVRDAADIVRVVGEYVPLKQAGQRLKGLCPFHQEKTPSFSVDPSRQLFYCFGCGTGGDVFKFVQIYEKLEFPEAAAHLAKRFGVPLPERRQRGDDPRERVLEANALAARFFAERLAEESVGKTCREYLERRGLERPIVERLGLGYAPDSWDGLRSHLLSRRFSPGEIVRAGLALERKSGQGEYDRFRDRLIFPIHDVSGRTVAFGGRALGDVEPKYLNSPETPAYTKGEHLYGLHLAREALRKRGFVVVVEGYMDLAALVQAGIDNVVASLGTAFTPEQARLLARFTERVVFSYDGDAAGAAATVRSMDLMLERGFEVRVVDLPPGMDPDDYIRAEGAEAYGRLIDEAPEYLMFLVRRAARDRDLSRPDQQVAAANEVLPHLSRLRNAIERAGWAGKLADALGIEDVLVMQELRKALQQPGSRVRRRPRERTEPGAAEARLVRLLLGSKEAREEARERLEEGDLDGTRIDGIANVILGLDEEGREVTYPAVLDALDDAEDRDLLTRLAFRDDPEDGPGVADCLWTLKRRRLERQGREQAGRIATLQKQGRETRDSDLDDHLRRLQELARARDAMSAAEPADLARHREGT